MVANPPTSAPPTAPIAAPEMPVSFKTFASKSADIGSAKTSCFVPVVVQALRLNSATRVMIVTRGLMMLASNMV